MTDLSAYRIIDRKKRGLELSSDEISWFIKGVTDGSIPDYQASAFLMAIYCRGMTIKETAGLTECMLNSGHVYHFRGKNIIDKHSTGGVGDKTSFILAPIAAVCGIKVPMVAGRGLGHTGGTVDKIESIKGFHTTLSLKQFEQRLHKNNIVMMGQTKKIAPADGILYALRDVTATIDSIPLITASIMSKKLAEGANGIVMDIKTGNGAFMVEQKQAEELGRSIIRTAKAFKKNATVLITDMNQPLGNNVGNSLEIIESIMTLRGEGPKDLTDLSVELSAHMVFLGGKAKSLSEARKKCWQALNSGAALKCFRDLITSQGGDGTLIDNPEKIPVAKIKTIVSAKKSGSIHSFNTKEVGMKLIDLKGGRKKSSDKLDLSVGFIFNCQIGDKVKKGDKLLTIYHHKSQQKIANKIKQDFIETIIEINSMNVSAPKLIKKVLK